MTGNAEPKRKYQKVQTVVGAFLILLPVGVTWYWGNMSIYVMSYILDSTSSIQGLGTPWVVTLTTVTWTLGVLACGPIASLIGKHAVVIFGIFVFNCSILFSYFSIQTSILMTSINLGVVMGFGEGLLEGTVLKFVVEWATDDTGFLTAFVFTAFPTGAMIIIQFVTHYVNPRNLSPDLKAGHMTFFSQDDVLGRVPPMFFVLGSASAIIQIFGFFMLRDVESQGVTTSWSSRPGGYGSLLLFKRSSSQVKPPSTKDCKTGGDATNNDNSIQTTQRVSVPSKTVLDLVNDESCKSDSSKRKHDNGAKEGVTKSQDGDPQSSITSEVTGRDYHPSEMLRSGAFYVISVAYLCGGMSLIALSAYTKSYGIVWIKDDHFLANMVTLIALVTMVLRLIWGLVIDKIGYEACLIVQFALMPPLFLLMYFSPIIDKWMYVCVNVSFHSVACSLDSVFMVFVVKQFGKKYFNTNLGLVNLCTVALQLAIVPTIEVLLSNWGWFSFFAWAASLNIIGLSLLTVFFIISKRNKNI